MFHLNYTAYHTPKRELSKNRGNPFAEDLPEGTAKDFWRVPQFCGESLPFPPLVRYPDKHSPFLRVVTPEGTGQEISVKVYLPDQLLLRLWEYPHGRPDCHHTLMGCENRSNPTNCTSRGVKFDQLEKWWPPQPNARRSATTQG